MAPFCCMKPVLLAPVLLSYAADFLGRLSRELSCLDDPTLIACGFGFVVNVMTEVGGR